MTIQTMRRIRQSIPSGYILGRQSAGTGAVEAIHLKDLATAIIATGSVVTTGGSGAGGQQWTAGSVNGLDASLTITAGVLSVTALPGVTALGAIQGGATLAITGSTLNVVGPQFDGLWVTVTWTADPASPLPTNVYNNGASGVGATLTATANGALMVDGGPPAVGDTILVNGESAGAHNGVYTVTATGGSGAKYVLTRTPGLDNPAAQVPLTVITSGAGATFPTSIWLSGNNLPLTIGSSVLSWAPFLQPDPPIVLTAFNELTLNFAAGLFLDGSQNLAADWAAGVVTHLGANLSLTGGTLTATGGSSLWNAGTVTALGTIAGEATVSAAGGTLSVAIPADKWGLAAVNALSGLSISGTTLVASGGTSHIYAPLVNGVTPGPNPLADPFGQFIMVPIS